MSFCKDCGNQIFEGENVCRYCGARVASVRPIRNSQAEWYAQSQQQVNVQPRYDYYTQHREPAKSQSNNVFSYGNGFINTPAPSEKVKPSKDRINTVSAIFFIFNILCCGLGLGLSIAGACAPYWGYNAIVWCDVHQINEQYLEYLDCDVIFVFSVIGICLFGIMLALSVIGAVMNFRKAKKQKSSLTSKQVPDYFSCNTAA